MGYIDRTFRSPSGAGFVSVAAATDRAYQPHPQRDENVSVARAANLLFHSTGDAKYRSMSDVAMRYLAAAPVATRLPVASVLLADYEVGRPPLHLTVVGRKDDPAAKALFLAALQYPSLYKRLEWWDAREGRLPNADVQYPSVPRAAAYVCTERTCSAPIFKAEEVAGKVSRVLGLQQGSTAAMVVPKVL
jgi:uncharacterized protein YyaL (SSP411 family)